MDEEHQYLSMIQLKKAVQMAAYPAEQQIDSLKHWCVADEIASDFDNYCHWALGGWNAPELTEEQRASLVKLDTWFTEMFSRRQGLGTDDAIRKRPEWEEVRRKAKKILNSFGWPLEG